MWGERETTSGHLQTIYVTTLIKKLKCTQTPDKDSIIIITCVFSNTSFKMTTYRLSRSTPVDSVACGGKEKQQVIICKQYMCAR